MPTHPSSPAPEPPSPNAENSPASNRTGRPPALDDVKRRDVCALVAAGCPMRDVARYVECSVGTIHRTAQRDPEFRRQLRRAKMHCRLTPLHAIQQAAATHWRAAAWILERPQHFGRRPTKFLGGRQMRRLAREIAGIIDDQVRDRLTRERLSALVAAAIESAIYRAGCGDRSGRRLREARKRVENLPDDPLAKLGIHASDVDALLRGVFEPATSQDAPGTPPSRPLDPNPRGAGAAQVRPEGAPGAPRVAKVPPFCGAPRRKTAENKGPRGNDVSQNGRVSQ